MKYLKRGSIVALVLAMLAAFAGCDTNVAPTSAMCAFIMGNGKNGTEADRGVHNIVYPGKRANSTELEEVKYAPCNSRNYIVNPAGQKNANGEEIGDYHIPIEAYTKAGTKLNVWLHLSWTLNQDPDVMKNYFFPFCDKYNCYSVNQDGSGNVNSASPGWNKMLGETMPLAIGVTTRQAFEGQPEEVWTKGTGWDAIAEAISAKFNDSFRRASGFAADMICGSGDSSGWPDPSKPGVGKFTCSQVRFDIDKVENADPYQQQMLQQESKNKMEKANNDSRLQAAKAIYGDQASYWMGLMDLVQKCRDAGTTCNIYVGDAPKK